MRCSNVAIGVERNCGDDVVGNHDCFDRSCNRDAREATSGAAEAALQNSVVLLNPQDIDRRCREEINGGPDQVRNFARTVRIMNGRATCGSAQ